MALDTTLVDDVTPTAEPKGNSGLAEVLRKLNATKPSATDRMFFTEQLSLLLETGTSLHPALRSIRTQITNPPMQVIVDGLADSVAEGRTFAQALGVYPDLFPSTYVNLVAAAETGGFLDKVLTELMRMDEKREELRRSVTSALSYPGFLLVFSLLVVVFVLVVVFPKFADLFANIRDELPGTTIALMAASVVLVEYWMIVVGVVVATVVAIAWWLKRPGGRAAMDALKMRAIVIKHIFIQVYLIQTLRVLGLSLQNGVSLPDALRGCREVVDNQVFRRFLTELERNVSQGLGFAVGFQQAAFIPSTVKQMVTTGEETGSLATVLGRIAEHYERELEKKLAAFSRMIEPLMLIVMGGVVGIIVSSLILPIFKLSRAVG